MPEPKRKTARKRPRRIGLLVLVVVLTGCALAGWVLAGKPDAGQVIYRQWSRRSPEQVRMRTFAAGNNAFACDLYSVQRQGQTGSFTFSPFSISSAVAMVHAGARGETRRQITQAMQYTLDGQELYDAIADQCYALESIKSPPLFYEEDRPQGVRLANSLWVDDEFNLLPDYERLVEKTFNSSITTVDFAKPDLVVGQINEWAAVQTEQFIEEVVSTEDIHKDIRLALVSSLSLFQAWYNGLEDSGWGEMEFFVDDKNYLVPAIGNTGQYDLALARDFAAVRLQAGGDGRISLLVLLPEERDGLAGLEAELTADLIAETNSNLREKRVQLALPKFEIEQRIELTDILQILGIVNAFTDAADLTGVGFNDQGVPLKLEKAFQQVRTIVDEDGIAAAAVTVITGCDLCGDRGFEPPPDDYVFTADHPFIFLIQDDQTGAILFIGRVVKPEYTLEKEQ